MRLSAAFSAPVFGVTSRSVRFCQGCVVATMAASAPPTSLFPAPRSGVVECPLLAKMPKYKATGDAFVDLDNEEEIQMYKDIIGDLWRDATHIRRMHQHLKRLKEPVSAVVEHKCFQASVTSLGKVPPTWVAQWCSGKHPAFTIDRFDKANAKDDTIVNQLLLFVLRWPPTMPLGKEFQTMAHLGILCNQRLEQVGRARLNRAAQCLAADGTYDKAKGGVYELVFGDNNIATQVRHVFGDAAPVPQHEPISREFMLMNWHSDEACVAEFGPSRRALHRFFPQASAANAPFDKKQAAALKNAVLQEAQTPAGSDAIREANRLYERTGCTRPRSSLRRRKR